MDALVSRTSLYEFHVWQARCEDKGTKEEEKTCPIGEIFSRRDQTGLAVEESNRDIDHRRRRCVRKCNPDNESLRSTIAQKRFNLPRSDRTNYEVISATTAESQIPSAAFTPSPLPPLPDRPTIYPTPHITNDDILTYLLPLYSYGWGIGREQHQKIDKFRTGIVPVSKPALIRRYTLANFSASISFMQDIAAICEEENASDILFVHSFTGLIEQRLL